MVASTNRQLATSDITPRYRFESGGGHPHATDGVSQRRTAWFDGSVQLSFENRTYLVTGGGSGIGKGVAAGLVAAGASVMIVGRNPDRLAAAVKEIEVARGRRLDSL